MNSLSTPARPPSLSLELEFRKVLRILFGSGWGIFAFIALALAAAGVYLWLTPRQYVSEIVVQVDSTPARVVAIQDVTHEELTTIEALNTVEQNLAGRGVVERLLDDPSLKLTPESIGLRPRPGKTYSPNEMIEQLRGAISAKLRRTTRLISVEVANEDPALAQKIATALVAQYRQRAHESYLEIAGTGNRFLVTEAEKLKAKLHESEQALLSYKQQTQSVSLDAKQDITTDSLKDLNMKLTQARAERLKLESVQKQLARAGAGDRDALLGVSNIRIDPSVMEEQKNLASKEAEFSSLKQWVLPANPRYVSAKNAVEMARAGLDQALAKAGDSARAQYETAAATEKSMEEALKEQEQKSLSLTQSGITYSALAREQESDRALLDSVLTRIKETDITKSIPQEFIQVAQPATYPDRPAKPRNKIVLGVAGGAGLFLGMISSVLLSAFHPRFAGVEEAERYLGAKVLGAVPPAKGQESGKGPLLAGRRDDPAAEAFRSMRTALMLALPRPHPELILFTSAQEKAGKTFCASNCAVSFAQIGVKTLLIDANLRRPALEGIFLPPAASRPGLSNILSRTANLADSVVPSQVDHLTLLTAGTSEQNPADLFSGDQFAQLISEATKTYQCVVVDAAPLGNSSEALLVCRCPGLVNLVIDTPSTAPSTAARALQELAGAGVAAPAVILNRFRQS